ncbi:short-chain dehydrogenase/reductase SDR [Oceanococcus atlanticus]|uniref:Short-chain dehydrogenase/reductase SDR n=1 Tax=Oceanococcus atlanticus TaxID=1317117 RepID=A0A1Y1SBC2_9GAMM|nr:SDR family NAD(P)-dependent oxidoreductase [Oceanococcus atlanticus]ORE85940.1 short-chain dehydrogenase/reductase SDR [Oceanococcus atlanticus]
MKDFTNKVAAITGAGSGMGRTLALNLAGRGCHLALSDVNTEGLEQTVALLKDAGVKVTADKVNVADREAMYQWADKVVADHGKVNLIFNNAGVALASTIAAVSYDELEWILGINMWGVIYGTKAFLPHLEASGEGHVINTSSLFGLCAQPTQSAYNISKFAVRGFTESLRQELDVQKSCVSATSVHPGGIKTNIARDSRANESIEQLTGKTHEQGVAEFEKFFITSAEKAAETIIRAVQANKRRVVVGPDAKVLDVIVRLFPASYQRLITWGFKRNLQSH